MSSQKRKAEEQLGAMVGKPVCAVMKDGSYYVGKVKAVKNGKLVLSGWKGDGHTDGENPPSRAQVSGFLGTMLGGGAGNSGAGGLGGVGSETPGTEEATGSAGAGAGFGGMMRTITLGLNMLQMIMPLLQFFRI